MMNKSHSNLAVITARSGSKGVKDKNIRLLGNQPLLSYTIEAAMNSHEFQCVHVSTDSDYYADIARMYGADVPFLRNGELATDTANSWDVLRDVVIRYEVLGRKFDTVTLLQPTSPFRTCQDIQNAFNILQEKAADAVVSVCKTEHSPLLCHVLGENQSMENFVNINKIGRRQEMPVFYQINGAIYIQRKAFLMERRQLYGKGTYAYIMGQKESIDIDTELDFQYAEFLLAQENE